MRVWLGLVSPCPPPPEGNDKGQAPTKQVGLSCTLCCLQMSFCYIVTGNGIVIGWMVKYWKCLYFRLLFAWCMLIQKRKRWKWIPIFLLLRKVQILKYRALQWTSQSTYAYAEVYAITCMQCLRKYVFVCASSSCTFNGNCTNGKHIKYTCKRKALQIQQLYHFLQHYSKKLN